MVCSDCHSQAATAGSRCDDCWDQWESPAATAATAQTIKHMYIHAPAWTDVTQLPRR
jgi:hypothetical protein